MYTALVKSQILFNILHPLRGGTPRRPTPLLALRGKSKKGDWNIVVFRAWKTIKISVVVVVAVAILVVVSVFSGR